MKIGILVLGVLTLSTALWSQGDGDQPDCFQTPITLSDQGCTYPHNCTETAGCSSMRFTVACTGTYQFDAWVECEECKKCESCVNIFDRGILVGNCHTSRCDLGECTYTCNVTLVAGVQYEMYVCLLPCASDFDCDLCGNCAAWGCVRYGQTLPCW
jgi:hypothetical protein